MTHADDASTIHEQSHDPRDIAFAAIGDCISSKSVDHAAMLEIMQVFMDHIPDHLLFFERIKPYMRYFSMKDIHEHADMSMSYTHVTSKPIPFMVGSHRHQSMVHYECGSHQAIVFSTPSDSIPDSMAWDQCEALFPQAISMVYHRDIDPNRSRSWTAFQRIDQIAKRYASEHDNHRQFSRVANYARRMILSSHLIRHVITHGMDDDGVWNISSRHHATRDAWTWDDMSRVPSDVIHLLWLASGCHATDICDAVIISRQRDDERTRERDDIYKRIIGYMCDAEHRIINLLNNPWIHHLKPIHERQHIEKTALPSLADTSSHHRRMALSMLSDIDGIYPLNPGIMMRRITHSVGIDLANQAHDMPTARANAALSQDMMRALAFIAHIHKHSASAHIITERKFRKTKSDIDLIHMDKTCTMSSACTDASFLSRHLMEIIKGQDRAVQKLALAIDRFHRGLYRGTVCIEGPTGCGKTFLVQETARMSGMTFVQANACGLVQPGITGTTMQSLVGAPFRNHPKGPVASKVILFIDEFDKILENHYGQSIISELLSITEGHPYAVNDQEQWIPSDGMLVILSGSWQDVRDDTCHGMGFTRHMRTSSHDQHRETMCMDGNSMTNQHADTVSHAGISIRDMNIPKELLGRIKTMITINPISAHALLEILHGPKSPWHTARAYIGTDIIREDGVDEVLAEAGIESGLGVRFLAKPIDAYIEDIAFSRIQTHVMTVPMMKAYVAECMRHVC
jgi:ATP-dependent protease Clp ATPase subunit